MSQIKCPACSGNKDDLTNPCVLLNETTFPIMKCFLCYDKGMVDKEKAESLMGKMKGWAKAMDEKAIEILEAIQPKFIKDKRIGNNN